MSVGILQRRIAYGGRKGRSALRRLRRLDPHGMFMRDPRLLRAFFIAARPFAVVALEHERNRR